MSGPLIDHIGIIVADLDSAIVRWSTVTGYTFTPVMHYRTDSYVDSSNPDPHFHDAKFVFSIEGPPFIELMQFSGDGTHSAAWGEGFHHLGIRVADAAARFDELAATGILADGMSLGADGRPILWFTERDALNRARVEYVGSDQQPVYDGAGELIVYDGPLPE